MAQKQCGKCGELVDEAKAFCPGCGNAFVEEEGREATRFDEMGSTAQIGQTMYNQMLSDMGLSVDKLVSDDGEPIRPPELIDASREPTENKNEIEKTSSTASKWATPLVFILGICLIALLVIAIILFFVSPRIS
jgi:hypothetical protein